MDLVGQVSQVGPQSGPKKPGQNLSVCYLTNRFLYVILYTSLKPLEVFMKIESRAILQRRIRNIEQDIKSCRNSGNTLRMRLLYAQLSATTIKLASTKK